MPEPYPSFTTAEKMPSGRPWDPVWGSFVREFSGSKCCKVRCKLCGWSGKPHASRMRLHLVDKHSTSMGAIFGMASDSSEAASLSSEPNAAVGSKRSAQPLMKSFTDRVLSTPEQERCTRLLAKAAVLNGWSHNSVCSPQSQELLTALRKDFVPPTPYKLRQMVTQLFEETKTAVEEKIRAVPWVHLAVDGWEDHQKLHVLAVTAIADHRHFLICFERHSDREYAENIEKVLAEACEYIKTLGSKVFSIISDNAANMQRAIKDSAASLKLVPLHCLAHSANLLIGDVQSLFSPLIAQAQQLVSFFSDSHYARSKYSAHKDRMNSGKSSSAPDLVTFLSSPGVCHNPPLHLCLPLSLPQVQPDGPPKLL